VITGDQEAELTFLGGLLPGMKPETSAVIDIGGGSTEIIANGVGQSIDVGSVRFTERFLQNLPRYRAGQPLMHQVDLAAGY
jgi:exopolyphosphatase/pppGpp-phosphohydrolase